MDENRFFDKVDMRCNECGDIIGRTAAILGCLLAILLTAVGFAAAILRKDSRFPRARRKLLRRIRIALKLWRRAGMRYKIKAGVGLYQCLTAIPNVYSVTIPAGAEGYTW